VVDTIAGIPLVDAVASALIRFLATGTAIGAVAALALAVLRRRSATLRYSVACLGLAVMLAAPIISVVRTLTTADRVAPDVVSARARVVEPVVVSTSVTAASGASPIVPGAWLSGVFFVWLAGVSVLTIRLCRSWQRARYLRRAAHTFIGGAWHDRLRELSERLGVRPGWKFAESMLIDVPGVIGVLHPVIVVPSGALARLSAAQLEAILAHELAHVRRADYLVNACQCVAEVLLFFHPLVWWLSNRIRIEREFCCDDVVIAAEIDRVDYASALASLEFDRSRAVAALGAGDGDLLTRIRRVLGPDLDLQPQFAGGAVMSAITAAVLLVMSTQLLGTSDPTSVPLPAVPGVIERAPQPATRTARTSAASASAAVTPARHTRTAAQAPAQPARGAIAAQAIDAQGGVIPGVTFTVTSPAGPGARTAITDARGTIRIDDVVPGLYEMKAELAGFRTMRSSVAVKAGETVNLVVRMALGSVSESVVVRPGTQVGGVSGGVPAGVVGGVANTGAAAGATATREQASGYFEAAKRYYEQGRLVEAESMTAQALEMLRAQISQTQLANALPPSNGPIRVGGDIREPKKIRDVKPAYPPEALAAGVSGVVMLEATIGKDGSVTDARILRSIAGLNEAALSAVREWRYTPTLLNGQPVEVIMTVTVNFQAK